MTILRLWWRKWRFWLLWGNQWDIAWDFFFKSQNFWLRHSVRWLFKRSVGNNEDKKSNDCFPAAGKIFLLYEITQKCSKRICYMIIIQVIYLLWIINQTNKKLYNLTVFLKNFLFLCNDLYEHPRHWIVDMSDICGGVISDDTFTTSAVCQKNCEEELKFKERSLIGREQSYGI